MQVEIEKVYRDPCGVGGRYSFCYGSWLVIDGGVKATAGRDGEKQNFSVAMQNNNREISRLYCIIQLVF